jgi:hypothetical protein
MIAHTHTHIYIYIYDDMFFEGNLNIQLTGQSLMSPIPPALRSNCPNMSGWADPGEFCRAWAVNADADT